MKEFRKESIIVETLKGIPGEVSAGFFGEISWKDSWLFGGFLKKFTVEFPKKPWVKLMIEFMQKFLLELFKEFRYEFLEAFLHIWRNY